MRKKFCFCTSCLPWWTSWHFCKKKPIDVCEFDQTDFHTGKLNVVFLIWTTKSWYIPKLCTTFRYVPHSAYSVKLLLMAVIALKSRIKTAMTLTFPCLPQTSQILFSVRILEWIVNLSKILKLLTALKKYGDLVFYKFIATGIKKFLSNILLKWHFHHAFWRKSFASKSSWAVFIWGKQNWSKWHHQNSLSCRLIWAMNLLPHSSFFSWRCLWILIQCKFK